MNQNGKYRFRKSLIMYALVLGLSPLAEAFAAPAPSAYAAPETAERTLTITVNDETGEPIIGASVTVAGTQIGAVTDFDGRCVLKCPANSVLKISYIGYKPIEMPVGEQSEILIDMQPSSTSLDEVVVMAYGSTVKSKVIASVTNVDMKQVENITGYKDMGNALQGRVPGVLVSNSAGGPDATPSISIRGGGDPMYIVNGIVSDKAAFFRIPAQDIESISIMKDAASCAVYGASAANGIIVVTTKSGREGSTHISYNFDGQFNTPTMKRDLINSLEYATLRNNISDYMGSAIPYSDILLAKIQSGEFADYPNINWWDTLIKKNSFAQRHTLTIDGGNENTRYRMSFMVYDQGSLNKHVAGDNRPIDYKTYSIDLRVDHTWKPAGVKLGLDLRPYLTDNRNYANADLWRNVQSMSPLDKVYNEDGSYAPNSAMAEYGDTNGSYSKNFNFGIDSRLNLDWDIKWVDGLEATFWGSYQLGSSNRKDWTRNVPTYNEDGSTVDATDPKLYMSKGYSWVYEYNVGLRYNNHFGAHTVGAGAYFNQREYYNESINAQRINYFDNVDQIFSGPADGQTNGGSANEGGRLGFVATLNYDYDSRYMLTASCRYDGNDGFAKGHKWGFFPSVAVGYMISNEAFMRSLKQSLHIDFFKLRASIGKIGETSSRFAYLSNWSVDQTGAYIGGTLVPVVWPAQLTTTDLSWYTTTTWNVGIDFSFLNSRLTGTADYFFRRTNGYLINPIDRYNSTLGNQTGRNGNTYTYGLPKVKSDDAFRRAGAEFSLNWQDNVGRDWSYSIGANITFYDELWEKYAQGDDAVALANPNQRTTHKTIGQGDRVYIYDGLFRTPQELLASPVQPAGSTMMAGDARYIDVNGDGQITDEDRVYDNKPRKSIMQWGVPFSVRYKAWSLSGLLQGSGPQYGMLHNNLRGTGWNKIYYTDQLDYYYPGNEDAKYPRADNDYGVWNGELNRANSSLWRINRTYARLKSLSITYDLKASLLKKCAWLGNASLSLTATNLFTICPSLKYADPETGPINDTATVQASSYPMTKTYSISVNLGF